MNPHVRSSKVDKYMAGILYQLVHHHPAWSSRAQRAMINSRFPNRSDGKSLPPMTAAPPTPTWGPLDGEAWGEPYNRALGLLRITMTAFNRWDERVGKVSNLESTTRDPNERLSSMRQTDERGKSWGASRKIGHNRRVISLSFLCRKKSSCLSCYRARTFAEQRNGQWKHWNSYLNLSTCRRRLKVDCSDNSVLHSGALLVQKKKKNNVWQDKGDPSNQLESSEDEKTWCFSEIRPLWKLTEPG